MLKALINFFKPYKPVEAAPEPTPVVVPEPVVEQPKTAPAPVKAAPAKPQIPKTPAKPKAAKITASNKGTRKKK
jgi:hypothetical protein